MSRRTHKMLIPAVLGRPAGSAWWLSGVAMQADFASDRYYNGSLTTLAALFSISRASPTIAYAEANDGSLLPFGPNTFRRTNRGLWIEGQSINRCLQSEALDNASWTKTAVTVTADQAAAPNGATTMDAVVPSAANTQHFTSQVVTVTAASYAVSRYVKPNGFYKFGILETVTGAYATFDLRGAGAIISTNAATAYVRAIANGTYRVEMIYTGTAAAHTFQFFPLDGGYSSGSPASYSYAGDGVSGTFEWGTQIELASRASSYIPTTTTTVTRSADQVTFLDATIKGAAATLLVVTPPQNTVQPGGSRLVDATATVPLNKGSDTQAQGYNGVGFATATIPFSAKYSTDTVWSMAAWHSGLLTVVANGGTPVTNANSMASITTAFLGAASGGGSPVNGPIAQVALWASDIGSSQMVSVSAAGATFDASATEAWGDSLTSGNQDGTGVTYPNVLAGLLGKAVYNQGVGGETSTQIKNRFIAFTACYGSPNIFQMGRNDYNTPTTVKSNIATCVAALTTTHYLVGSILPAATDSAGNLSTISTLNSDLATLYGARFVDLLTPLQAASDGSAGDIADVAAGIIPRSCRASGDPLHLNSKGYTVVANAYYANRALLGL